MSLTLRRITFFVEDLPAATSYYSDVLGIKGSDIRSGWSAYKISGKFEIAFHRGKGRKPRLEFVTKQDLVLLREKMNKEGARLGPIKEVSQNVFKCVGKDPEKNRVEIFSVP